jgi:hypothetical protein
MRRSLGVGVCLMLFRLRHICAVRGVPVQYKYAIINHDNSISNDEALNANRKRKNFNRRTQENV